MDQRGALFVRGDASLSLLCRQPVVPMCNHQRSWPTIGPYVDSDRCRVDVRAGHHFLGRWMCTSVYGVFDLPCARNNTSLGSCSTQSRAGETFPCCSLTIGMSIGRERVGRSQINLTIGPRLMVFFVVRRVIFSLYYPVG